MKRSLHLSCMLVCVGASIGQAQVLETVYVRASSFNGSNLLPKYAINGDGLQGATHSNYPPFTAWASASGSVAGAWFECDLGQLCDITQMTLYNYSDTWSQLDYTDRGIYQFKVWLSNDGVNYTLFGGTRTALKAIGKRKPGDPPDGWHYTIFDLTGAVARFVKINVISNYGGPLVGFSELVLEGGHSELGTNVPPSSITAAASSTLSGYNIQNVVNGNGLIADGYGAHTYTDQSSGPNGWIGSLNSGPVELTFTFDRPYSLAAARIWNMDSWFGQGNAAAKDFQLLVSTDGANFTSVTTGQLNPYVNSTVHDYSLSFDLAADNVVAVKMVITSSQVSETGNVGLNEIQFVQATGPIIPLTLTGTIPDEHGHWYDDVDETYRVYDRWYFDANDVSIDLSAHDSINFFIRLPTGYMIEAAETCSLTASVSMYDTTWTVDPQSGWSLLGGTSQLQGIDVPAATANDFATKIDGTRQFSVYYLSDDSSAPWYWRSLILSMDISTLTDAQTSYSFGNNPGAFLLNDVTFSSQTESSTDPGIFTAMIADVDYTLEGFALLARTWLLSDGEEGYDDTWDFHADAAIDMDDLTIFCQRWLLGQ